MVDIRISFFSVYSSSFLITSFFFLIWSVSSLAISVVNLVSRENFLKKILTGNNMMSNVAQKKMLCFPDFSFSDVSFSDLKRDISR